MGGGGGGGGGGGYPAVLYAEKTLCMCSRQLMHAEWFLVPCSQYCINSIIPPGDLEKAASHMETFHHLCRQHKWHTESGDSLHDIACEHLRRIYTAFAEQVL